MKKTSNLLLQASFWLIPALTTAQGLDPALMMKPLGESWPTYSGDYSGRRYSSLTQLNQSNVKNLTLSWVTKVTAGLGTGGGGRGGFGNAAAPTIVGGEGTTDVGGGGFGTGANIRASILQVNGVLYVSTPDNAWAIDAHDGHEMWHYFWKTKGGTHIGNRGLGMWGNWLYMETPDDYLICLDSKTGKERWHKEIADFNLQYFSTMSPIVIGNHILIGTGNDLDEPGYIEARDPETGDVQWHFSYASHEKGRPGFGNLGQPGRSTAWSRKRMDSRFL